MNTKYKNAVVISRDHPNMNFGQTLDILEYNKTNAVVRPHGSDSKYTVDIGEIWPFERSTDYEEYNKAVDKARGWPWQDR